MRKTSSESRTGNTWRTGLAPSWGGRLPATPPPPNALGIWNAIRNLGVSDPKPYEILSEEKLYAKL